MGFKASDLLPMLTPVLVALLSLVEVSPIKINPWSGLAKWLGRAINGEVLSTMQTIQTAQKAQADALAGPHQGRRRAQRRYPANARPAF